MNDLDWLSCPTGQLIADELSGQLAEPILAHSIRVFALAMAECRRHGWDVSPEELLIAALFHDSGTIPDTSPERFEVVGADRAAAFAARSGRDPDSCAAIWDAVALHTSPGIAERHRPLTRAVRAGVLTDFGDPQRRHVHQGLIAAIETTYPRADVEIVLAEAVVAAAKARPGKAPAASWPADLVRGSEHLTAPGQPNPLF